VRLTVLGSGGALVTPRPACRCRVCADARGNPAHARGGPSLYVHEGHVLLDAPEDILPMLTRAGIDRVDHLLLSHWHPDHTAGFRVVEQLTWELALGGPARRIDVWLNRDTLERRAGDWAYFERRGYCRLNVVEPEQELRLGPLTARVFAYAPDQILTGFLLSDGRARVLLAVDETKGLIDHLPAWAIAPDLLVAECGFFDRDAEGGRLVPERWPMRRTEAGFEADTRPLLRAVRAGQTLLVHLNGCLVGRTPLELADLEAELGARFAVDGLTIEMG
jgi:phosphoribosyl 1,2-cyclic phosphate phosphodiesterase